MENSEFRDSIRDAFSALREGGLLESPTNPSSLKVSDRFNELALSGVASYPAIYHRGLELAQYNCLLRDYSYFQYSIEDRKSWRLAYYPSPYFSGCAPHLQDLDELRSQLENNKISLTEFEEFVADGFEAVNRVPMLRFEYSEIQHKKLYHPAAHLHIGVDGNDRLASRIKMSPLSFTMLVMRSYYSSSWWPRTSLKNDGESPCIESRFRVSLHSDGLSRLFEPDEAFSLHLSLDFPGP